MTRGYQLFLHTMDCLSQEDYECPLSYVGHHVLGGEQTLKELIPRGLQWCIARIYLEGAIITNKNIEEHVPTQEQGLERFRMYTSQNCHLSRKGLALWPLRQSKGVETNRN